MRVSGQPFVKPWASHAIALGLRQAEIAHKKAPSMLSYKELVVPWPTKS